VSVYALLWELVKHALHGRGRDEIHLTVTSGDSLDALLSGELEHFTWAGDDDRFCVLSATDGGVGMTAEQGELLDRLRDITPPPPASAYATQHGQLADRDLLRIELAAVQAELVSARTELDQLRNRPVIVAPDGRRYCERCEGEICRRQDCEPMPGSGGLMLHIHCPDAAA
jgi:hypothetical protein